MRAKRMSPGKAVIAGLLLTALPAYRLTAQCPDGSPPPCGSRARAAVAPATSVAVLYFDNLSRDTTDTYLADGLTDELITRLGQLERIQVKSRNAVRRFRGDAAEDPAAVGRALNVAHLVSGSVRRNGERVRVTVELTRAATGAHLWGDVIERSSADLMSVESDVASAIATAVAGRLAPAEREALAARPTTSGAAYDRVLRGDFFLARRTGADATRALAEYEAARQLDPRFTRAWARIALARYLFLDWDWPAPVTRDSMLALGSLAADRALALDSNSADAWTARGLLLTVRNAATMDGVIDAMERAMRLDPRNPDVLHQAASVYMVNGRDAQALAAFRRALAIDPQKMIAISNMGWVLHLQGRHQDALVMLDSAISTNPDAYYPRVLRGAVRLKLGDVAGASADAEAAVRLRPPGFVFDSELLPVAIMAARGDSAGARARAGALAAQFPGDGPLSYAVGGNVAIALAQAGMKEPALAMLERSRISGINLWWLLRDPMLDPIRAEPRFQRLQAGLAPPSR